MVDVIYYVLLTMVGIYFTWLVLRNLIKRIFKFEICAICATIVSTWSGLLVMKLIGYAIPQSIVAILMGGSVVGFMYFLERRVKTTENKNLLLIKPLVILFGVLIVYLILSGVYR
ncbi:MAG: hypothetical protein QW818_02290 [Candidatus Aenigmatarchaeota archaeon]|nr:hypothetical protein [Candidatus Aenigmarchaeota archaeon]